MLGLVVADALVHRFPREPEGRLAQRLAYLVSRDALARVAAALSLGDHLALAKGDGETGNRVNPGILADALEAVIAALYLDGGLATARRFVLARWETMFAEAVEPPRDAKTTLQEWTMARAAALPAYAVVRNDGPAHDPLFEIAVAVEGFPPASGTGRSKRLAEQAAAAALLALIRAAHAAAAGRAER